MSVHQRIFDDVVLHEVVKEDLFEFIGIGHTNKLMVLCELNQDFFLVRFGVQDLRAICQCYKGVLIGGDPTELKLWRNKMSSKVSGRLKGGWVVLNK